MSQIAPLDQIIKQEALTSGSRLVETDEKRVLLDVSGASPVVLDRAPFLRLGREIRSYRVSTRNEILWEGPTKRIEDLMVDGSLRIRTRFRLRCRPGAEQTLARALGGDTSPSQALARLFERWIDDYLREVRREGRHVLKDFDDYQPQLAEWLSDRAGEELGLDAECLIELADGDRLKPIEIVVEALAVRVVDASGVHSLKLKTGLSVDPERRFVALTRTPTAQSLEDCVRGATEDYFREHVRLHDFRFDLDRKVGPALTRALDEALEVHGRKVRYLELEAPSGLGSPETFEVRETIRCTIQDSDEPVEIKNTIRFALEDVALWETAGFGSLEAWYRPMLRRVVPEPVFDCSYLELVTEFDNVVSTAIKDEVRSEAARVGYSVRHHLLLPELEPLSVVDGFTIDSRQTYATRDFNLEVELAIHVEGRIPDLRPIRALLKPRTQLKPLIQGAIEEAAKTLLHETEPRDFYLYFEARWDGNHSFHEGLTAAVQRALERKFHATDVRVIAKKLPTRLDALIRDLCKGQHTFEVVVVPTATPDYRSATYECTFELTHVSDIGWEKFLVKSYDTTTHKMIDDIIDIMRRKLSAALPLIDPGAIFYVDLLGLSGVSKIFALAALEVHETFGLVVRPITCHRRLTEGEEMSRGVRLHRIEMAAAEDKAIARASFEERKAMLAQLHARLRELIRSGAPSSDEERRDVERRISEIERAAQHLPANYGPEGVLGRESAQLGTGTYEDVERALNGSMRQLQAAAELGGASPGDEFIEITADESPAGSEDDAADDE